MNPFREQKTRFAGHTIITETEEKTHELFVIGEAEPVDELTESWVVRVACVQCNTELEAELYTDDESDVAAVKKYFLGAFVEEDCEWFNDISVE